MTATLKGAEPKQPDSRLLVFSGTCAYTNFSTNSRPVSSFRGFFRFATDLKHWSLEYTGDPATQQKATFDGQSLCMLNENLTKQDDPGRLIDVGELTVTDVPPLFAPARLPWFAAWSCGLIPPPTKQVLPPWALWTHASVYETQVASSSHAACPSKDFEFIFRAREWNRLRSDPRKRAQTDNADITRADYTEGIFDVSACTNVGGASIPLTAHVRRLFSPERGGGMRALLVMNTTNVQQIAGIIEKPRLVKPAQVNDWRATSATLSGLREPMTRPVTYYVSNSWLETTSPEWQTLVQSNALHDARTGLNR